MTHFKSILS